MKPPQLFLLLAAALGAPLAAQTLSYGVAAGAEVPTNDLRSFNSHPGGALGGFMDLDLGGGSVFRPRIDGVWVPRKSENDGGTKYQRDIWGCGLSVDYLYHFSGSRRGLFAVAGVGLYHLAARIQGGDLDRKDKTNQLGGSMGLGYTLNAHWDVDLHFRYTSFTSSLPSQRAIANPTAAMVILAANYRF